MVLANTSVLGWIINELELDAENCIDSLVGGKRVANSSWNEGVDDGLLPGDIACPVTDPDALADS